MDHPPQNMYPVLRYKDAHAAIDFLCEAFGFERNAVYEGDDGLVDHAQLEYSGGMVMLSTERDNDDRGYGKHAGQGWIYVAVDDPDAHYAQAKAAGATIFRELEDQHYGSRDYSARDPEGNIWSFGTYNPAVAPAETGEGSATSS